MWKYDDINNQYKINLLQLISGISKEYLMELEIPPIYSHIDDNERNTILISSNLRFKPVG